MTTPATAFDPKLQVNAAWELSRKLIKAYEAMRKIGDLEVGAAPKELVFEYDKIKLYHYQPEAQVTCRVPVLIAYALVNRPSMLDLQPDRSFIRRLLQQGLEVYAIDWGYPTRLDKYVSLDDCINVFLNDCVDFICASTRHNAINLMGICQGGTFAAIYAALHPHKIKNLVTIVTPIDFSTNDGLLFRWSKSMNVDAMVDIYGIIPGDVLSAGYLMLRPFMKISKYVEALDMMEDREKVENFLRLEQWILDSPAQAGECYRQFVKDLYQQNKLVKGGLVVGEQRVEVKKITMPLLNIYANDDHIVPPEASKPLNDLVGSTDKELYSFKGGHIGVFVSARSQKELAPAIASWLHQREE
ncbi:MAG: class III poly(R)-hydroxyalkanoic acid synthase subunit PhaC [bacterium]